MKKNIQYILLVISVIFLTSCGSNSKKDPIIDKSSVTVNGYAFSENVDSLEIDSYKTYNIKFKLTEDDLAVVGATVLFKNFDSKYGTIETITSTTDDSGKGSFRYIPPTDMPASGSSHTIQYLYKTVGANGSTQDLKHNVKLDFNFDSNNGGNGRATTLSISYLTTECDAQRGIIGHYNVHAVDQRSNLPIVGMDIDFSLINGVKIIKGTKIQNSSGHLQNTNPLTFSDNRLNFASNTNVSADDNLIILPSQGVSDIPYLGGWNINDVAKDLTLFGQYNNISGVKNLTYIIGNEKRLLGGEDGRVGTPTAAHVKAVDAVTDSNGFAYFDIVFDSILGGHTVVIEANGEENGRRYGTSKREFLRLDNFNAPTVEIINSGGIRNVFIPISIEPGCIGKQPLIDVPVGQNSFRIEPTKNCAIVGGDFLTNSGGSVRLEVASDGNFTDAEKCTITWEGGAQSLRYEY